MALKKSTGNELATPVRYPLEHDDHAPQQGDHCDAAGILLEQGRPVKIAHGAVSNRAAVVTPPPPKRGRT